MPPSSEYAQRLNASCCCSLVHVHIECWLLLILGDFCLHRNLIIGCSADALLSLLHYLPFSKPHQAKGHHHKYEHVSLISYRIRKRKLKDLARWLCCISKWEYVDLEQFLSNIIVHLVRGLKELLQSHLASLTALSNLRVHSKFSGTKKTDQI